MKSLMHAVVQICQSVSQMPVPALEVTELEAGPSMLFSHERASSSCHLSILESVSSHVKQRPRPTPRDLAPSIQVSAFPTLPPPSASSLGNTSFSTRIYSFPHFPNLHPCPLAIPIYLSGLGVKTSQFRKGFADSPVPTRSDPLLYRILCHPEFPFALSTRSGVQHPLPAGQVSSQPVF